MFLRRDKRKKTGFFKKRKKENISLAKTPLCACLNGSLTVEAAFVAPFAVFFMVLFLSFFPVLELQKDVEEAMQYAARKTSACAVTYKGEEDGPAGSLPEMGELLTAKGLFWKKLRQSDPPIHYVPGSYGGISLLGSGDTDLYVELCASYHVQMPVRLFGRQRFLICQQVRARKWNGYEEQDGDGGASDGEKVYITENGHAYHKDLSCNYLDLSIRSVSRSAVKNLRSADGSKYHSCTSCRKKNPDAAQVYVTTYGTEYHTTLDCGSLRRRIQAVDREDVQGRTPCPKCYGGK